MKITALILTIASLFFNGYSLGSAYTPQTKNLEFIGHFFNKSSIAGEKYTGKESKYVWDEEGSFEAFELQRAQDRDFKILNLADIHFSDYGYRAFYSISVEAKIRALCEKEKPDLIILSGDFVCSDYNEYSIRRLADLMQSLEIPFAFVFGNHDREGNCDGNYLSDRLLACPNCIFAKGDERMGQGNYIIKIKNPDNSLAHAIFMMDSHSSIPNALQLQWLEKGAKELKNEYGEAISASVFEHIPLPEYDLAYEQAVNAKEEYDLKGEKNEKICCQRDENGLAQSSEMFEKIKQSGIIKNVFCSHDHMNDFSLNYEGIRLTYCMKIGKCSGYQPGFDGATVINIGSNGIKEFHHISKGRQILRVDYEK